MPLGGRTIGPHKAIPGISSLRYYKAKHLVKVDDALAPREVKTNPGKIKPPQGVFAAPALAFGLDKGMKPFEVAMKKTLVVAMGERSTEGLQRA